MAEIDEIFESFSCKICFRDYSLDLPAQIVCKNIHLMCKKCYNDIEETLSPKCPFCIERLTRPIEYSQIFNIKTAVTAIIQRERQYIDKIKQLSHPVVTYIQEKVLVDHSQYIILQNDNIYLKKTLEEVYINCENYSKKINEMQVELRNRQNIIAENERLRAEVARLQNQNRFVKQLQDENHHLWDSNESLSNNINYLKAEKERLILQINQLSFTFQQTRQFTANQNKSLYEEVQRLKRELARKNSPEKQISQSFQVDFLNCSQQAPQLAQSTRIRKQERYCSLKTEYNADNENDCFLNRSRSSQHINRNNSSKKQMKLNLVGSTSYKKLPSFIYQLHKAEFQSIQK